MAAELIRDQLNPAAFRVEFIDGDGGCEVAAFGGPKALERAMQFADSYYGSWDNPQRLGTARNAESALASKGGKDLLVKIADGEGFTTVAGLRSRRLSFNAETVDVSNPETASRWRGPLEGAGIKRAAIAGRGLFKDASSDALIRQTFFDGAVKNYQIIIPDFGTVQGAFQVTSLEFAGDHNGEVTYELALESAGALTFVAS